MNLLFLGGPKDGQRINVPDDLEYFRVLPDVSKPKVNFQESGDMCEAAQEIQTYRRETIRTSPYSEHQFFVLNTITTDRAITLLIDGYGKRDRAE